MPAPGERIAQQQWLQGSGGVIGVAEASDFFGAALAAGDFNNNGFADLAIGAIGEDVGGTQDAGALNACLARAERALYTRWRAISFLVRVRYKRPIQ